MEQQLAQLLAESQSAQEAPRRNAESQLKQQGANPDFPLALISIGAREDVPLPIRQAAIMYLKRWVEACWSVEFDTFGGWIYPDDGKRNQIRQSLLNLVLGGQSPSKITSAASVVVSKIALSDFPDDWPDLLQPILNILATGTDAQLHGALKVLQELLEECFNETHFFVIAQNLVKTLYDVASNASRKPILRALTLSVFRSCFDLLEIVMENYKAEVKSFVDEAMKMWIPLFLGILDSPLPTAPGEEDSDAASFYRGCVALKLQVGKVLMRIRTLLPSTLSPQSQALFSATWKELSTHQMQYYQEYIVADKQGRLEDSDGLPYTLDFLVLEELDFLQACLRAPPIRKELDQQLKSGNSWLAEMMKLAVAYAHVTQEEEGMWSIDVNVFLSEEANVTANYTPRTACGDLAIKLGEWIQTQTVEALLAYIVAIFAENTDWKAKEAALYLFNQLLCDLYETSKGIGRETLNACGQFIQHAIQNDEALLRARGFLVAGNLARVAEEDFQQAAAQLMQASLHALNNDDSDIVRVSCIRALQNFVNVLPRALTSPHQSLLISSFSNFIASQDVSELAESDDVLMTLVESLKDMILLDATAGLTNGGIDLLLTLGRHGTSNFQIVLLVCETFEEIAGAVSANGRDSYVRLSDKMIPSLLKAFDVATLESNDSLAGLAADLLSILAEKAWTPMPPGFVASVMPRLSNLLLQSEDDELLKSATAALKHMLSNDPEQVFAYTDQAGQGGLQVVLIIIDRLLNPAINENGAVEVGGLAAEAVEKAGAERLGPYLPQLLRAVAIRLASAEKAHFIQSLIMVFARLSLISAPDVINFLADVNINGQNGLHIVMSKWLANCVTFAGYNDIRQSVTALASIYSLEDARLMNIQVKGDLVVPKSDRIVTRSRAKQQPEQYTTISAQLKIFKVLADEVLVEKDPTSAGALAETNDDDDASDWEDESDSFLNLASGMTKAELMAYGNEEAEVKVRDDQTQGLLRDFFTQQALKPGFGELFNALTEEQRGKVRSVGR
ncbi:ARM repeat-containing protein [Piedraia hortae CBS 480.64]|uniref:ARM repeat-containing protein n=1 Tax=Piedraia hortae CBS 480.64 TaxID=1314780 RepID=A0A6A7BPT4_9PEZI|nr:ARM repeat-containing protein [Piedraia hortae CBS 480.64]